MALPALLLPILGTLFSAGASYVNTRNVAKKQDSIAAQGIRQAAARQREVNQRLNQTIDKTASSTGEASRNAANNDYLAHLQRRLAQGTQGLRGRGISGAYDEAAAQGAGQAGDYAATIAGLLSRIDAGPAQRQAEQNLMGDFSMDASRIGGEIQGDQFLNGLRMKGVRRNPYLDLAAGVAKAYAMNGMGGVGAGDGGALDTTGWLYGSTPGGTYT